MARKSLGHKFDSPGTTQSHVLIIHVPKFFVLAHCAFSRRANYRPYMDDTIQHTINSKKYIENKSIVVCMCVLTRVWHDMAPQMKCECYLDFTWIYKLTPWYLNNQVLQKLLVIIRILRNSEKLLASRLFHRIHQIILGLQNFDTWCI